MLDFASIFQKMEAFKKAVRENLEEKPSFRDAVKLIDLKEGQCYEILHIRPVESRFGKSWVLAVLVGADGSTQDVWANR